VLTAALRAEAVAARLDSGEAQQAREIVSELVRHTPVLSSRSLSEQWGSQVQLKAENLQRTCSFKIRGASNMVAQLSAEERARGVIAASAITSTTAGRPSVRVPVLSNATQRMRSVRSRCAPPLISTPLRAAPASAATIETGVEITSAHGQETTSSTSAR